MADDLQGEIIWRLTYQVDATESKERPEPVLLILADQAGWRYLAKQFNRIAELKAGDVQSDPDNHHHLGYSDPPVNGKLSHHVELRCGILTATNREHVFKKYEIDEPPSEDHDLRTLFGKLIQSADHALK